MDLPTAMNLAETVESVVTTLGIVAGGVWAYRRYFRERGGVARIELNTSIRFIGKDEESWLLELAATVENKGHAIQWISDFTFDLRVLEEKDKIQDGPETIGGRVNFPRSVRKGSWVPGTWEGTFIEPGVRNRYSYQASIPVTARFALLYVRFAYGDDKRGFHTADTVSSVPSVSTLPPEADVGEV